jgi:hypothetical protein
VAKKGVEKLLGGQVPHFDAGIVACSDCPASQTPALDIGVLPAQYLKTVCYMCDSVLEDSVLHV